MNVAAELEAGLRPFVRGDLPVRIKVCDGSEVGPLNAPLVEVRSPQALRRMIWSPGELGAARRVGVFGRRPTATGSQARPGPEHTLPLVRSW